MADKDEFSFIVRDGVELYGVNWSIEAPKAAICLVHGLGEHSGRYAHVADFFNQQGFDFYGFDLRGHGLSEGRRGHTPSLERSIDDVEEFLMYVRAEHNDLPLFLYGHSLGGNFVINYLLKKSTKELTGAMVSSPWLIALGEPSSFEVKLARYLSKFFPGFQQSNRLNIDHLTSSDKVNLAYKNDPLVHDRISARLFVECLDGGRWAIAHADLVKLPTLIFHGDQDQITDLRASREFAEKAGDLVNFKVLEDTKHEGHNDTKQSELMGLLCTWLLSRL